MLFDLTGHVAVVTGAAQNVGAGIARMLASRGRRSPSTTSSPSVPNSSPTKWAMQLSTAPSTSPISRRSKRAWRTWETVWARWISSSTMRATEEPGACGLRPFARSLHRSGPVP